MFGFFTRTLTHILSLPTKHVVHINFIRDASVEKLLSNKFSFFGYCIGSYIILVFVVNLFTSPIFLIHISKSLAAVLLAYWVAKMFTRFIAIRTYLTPVFFLVVQIVAMTSGVTFSREISGNNFTMWTCGVAIIIFIIAQVILKKIVVKRRDKLNVTTASVK